MNDALDQNLVYVSDLDPSLLAAIDDLDLACIADYDDDGSARIDAGTLYHVEAYVSIDLGIDTPESPQWVQAAIEAQPGVWTARLCRQMHGWPETEISILRCGLCQDYANPRKRARAACLPTRTLPGFEAIGGGHQLRPPCSKRGLTWLRKLIYRLRDRDQIQTHRERIPDCRQPRGWDWGTRIYSS
jgi:hypothetical protein